VARAFHQQWVCRFGVPECVTTDRGRQFESELYTHLNRFYGTQRIRTTAYNPKANGLVERFHRTLKAALRAHNDPQWSETLPTVMLGVRTALREDTNCSPAEMIYGKSITLPGEFLEPKSIEHPNEHEFIKQLRITMQNIKPTPGPHHGNHPIFIQKNLNDCSHVFLRDDTTKPSLDPRYKGPFEVIQRNDKFFKIIVKNKEETVSIDRLKPAYILNEDLEATEPKTTVLRSGRRVRFVK
jgi:cleavage and polyadenylation specificity factor subunit 1